ncbi:hypothetical protein EDD18DRAFT_1297231 [Armillaria luteobubalina]|uniref:Uncharacterized protein n=1 Tax=Armillaria luteobubalina TaxID=153913 RepID=A0AA39UFN5_9AGAR|nr:hypothetical protein EDD18DRAFT_1297231 [Armillaria luteobubalina]
MSTYLIFLGLAFILFSWGKSKNIMPSSEKDLEVNVLKSLEEVDIIKMRRFATRSLRFMDAYQKGLNGAQAAWAVTKYRGHHLIPETILRDLDNAQIH